MWERRQLRGVFTGHTPDVREKHALMRAYARQHSPMRQCVSLPQTTLST